MIILTLCAWPNNYYARVSMMRESAVIQEIRIMSDDDPSIFPCGREYILITSPAQAKFLDVLHIVSGCSKGPSNFDTGTLVNKKSSLAPKGRV